MKKDERFFCWKGCFLVNIGENIPTMMGAEPAIQMVSLLHTFAQNAFPFSNKQKSSPFKFLSCFSVFLNFPIFPNYPEILRENTVLFSKHFEDMFF